MRPQVALISTGHRSSGLWQGTCHSVRTPRSPGLIGAMRGCPRTHARAAAVQHDAVGKPPCRSDSANPLGHQLFFLLCIPEQDGWFCPVVGDDPRPPPLRGRNGMAGGDTGGFFSTFLLIDAVGRPRHPNARPSVSRQECDHVDRRKRQDQEAERYEGPSRGHAIAEWKLEPYVEELPEINNMDDMDESSGDVAGETG